MIPVMCVVQEGQLSVDAENALKSEINSFVKRAFDAVADIDWIVVPRGSGFTAAKPSNSLITSLQANRALDQDERISMLRELGDICTSKAGRSSNEVIAAIRDGQ